MKIEMILVSLCLCVFVSGIRALCDCEDEHAVWKELECEQRRSAFRISKGRQSACVERKRCSAVRGILFQELVRKIPSDSCPRIFGYRVCSGQPRVGEVGCHMYVIFGKLSAVRTWTHFPITNHTHTRSLMLPSLG